MFDKLISSGSYHSATVEYENCSYYYYATNCPDVELSEIAIEGIVSGKQSATASLGWYGNIGLHILGIDYRYGSDDSTKISFGGGVTGTASVGEWYAGVDFIDEMVLVAGFRYNLN